MSKMFMLLLGMSPVIAIILYFVLQKQDQFDKQIEVHSVNMVLSEKKFDRDFYENEAEFTADKKIKESKLKKAENVNKEIKEIEERKKEAERKRREAELKAEQELENIDKELESLDKEDFTENDLNFKENDLNF